MKISSIEGQLPDGRWLTVADPNVSIEDQRATLDRILLNGGRVKIGKSDVQLVYVHRRDTNGVVKRKTFAAPSSPA